MTESKAITARLQRLLTTGDPAARQARVTYDTRDGHEPWTVEVLTNRHTVCLRTGRSLQEALTAAMHAAENPPERRTPAPG